MDDLQHAAEHATFVIWLGGGLIGTVMALSIRPPKTIVECVTRAACGVSAAFVFTGLVAQYFGIAQSAYEIILAVGAGIGFFAWHLGTVLMILMDAALGYVEQNKLGILSTLANQARQRIFPGKDGDQK